MGSGKPIAGQSLHLFCNVTTTGHPEQILGYVWQRNNRELKGTNRIHGEMTSHLTVKISICYDIDGIYIFVIYSDNVIAHTRNLKFTLTIVS